MQKHVPLSEAEERWLRNPAGELFWRTKAEEAEAEDPPAPPFEVLAVRKFPTDISCSPHDLCSPFGGGGGCCCSFGLLDELARQVDSDVMEEESPEKYCWWPMREDGDRRAENSRFGPMTESTAVVRREPGAEP